VIKISQPGPFDSFDSTIQIYESNSRFDNFNYALDGLRYIESLASALARGLYPPCGWPEYFAFGDLLLSNSGKK